MTKTIQQFERCPHCGASMKAYWQNLTPGLVSALISAIVFVNKNNKNFFHLQKDLSLSKTQYNNFQKLRFHALVAKTEKAGYWLITKRGGQFLRGEIEVPKEVLTFRNRVKEHSVGLVGIKSFRGKVPYFDSEFAYEYQPVAVVQNALSI